MNAFTKLLMVGFAVAVIGIFSGVSLSQEKTGLNVESVVLKAPESCLSDEEVTVTVEVKVRVGANIQVSLMEHDAIKDDLIEQKTITHPITDMANWTETVTFTFVPKKFESGNNIEIYAKAADARSNTVIIKMLKINIENLRHGATISGHVPDSYQCSESYLTEIVLGAGPDKGKKVKVVAMGHNTKGLWLGVTAVIDGVEEDFPVEVVNGNFSKSYSVSYDFAKKPTAKVVFVARLWTTKVSAEACAFNSRNGKMCVYCSKNGYHMEGSVVSTQK